MDSRSNTAKGQPRRFISGHNVRLPRKQTLALPEEECGCGCGLLSGFYAETRTSAGKHKGAPRAYLPGHSSQRSLAAAQEWDAHYCECGCGELTNPTDATRIRRGDVRGKPRRFLNGHSRFRTVERMFHPEEGFYSIDTVTGCWVWLRNKDGRGYGVFQRKRKHIVAHRAFYEEAKGPIPSGLVIDHTCFNPSCVNPDHLEAVTNKENVRRGRLCYATLGIPPVGDLVDWLLESYAGAEGSYVIHKPTGCWIWLGRRTAQHYGVIYHGNNSLRAHRVLYEEHVGPIPPRLVLDHLCGLPICVCPAHLEPVTRAENSRRRQVYPGGKLNLLLSIADSARSNSSSVAAFTN